MLRCHPRRIIRRQGAGDLLQVLKSHSDVEPVEDRQFGDAGTGQNASKARTPIGEGRQRGAIRSADGVEVPADQHFDVRVGSGDGAENLAATRLRFHIANPYLQVTFSVLATPDEGGIQSDRDRRRRRFRPDRSTIPKCSADSQGVATHG
jgi:hypothetical protein